MTPPAATLDHALAAPGPSGLRAWSSAWRTVAAITVFEILLAGALRWSLPRLIPPPGLQIGLGYIVFMALGEIWGQWLHWAGGPGGRPTRDALRFLRSADWASVIGMILLTALFFSWFWPWTFRLWGMHLPGPWFGVADQVFTGPLSLTPIFLMHAALEARRAGTASGSGWRAQFAARRGALLDALRVALPYWGIGLGVIFSLPVDFVFQNILTGAIQTPFTTFLFFMANRPHHLAETKRMRSWAKWALPFIAVHNFVVFPLWCGGWTLAVGLLGYAAWLGFGFQSNRRTREGATPSSPDFQANP